MRNIILGFSQEKLVENNMDIIDAMLLRYIVDFKESGAMMTEIYQGETYYWVSYDKVITDLPSLYMKKDAVYRRLKKLSDLKILKRFTKKQGGTFSFYALGELYKTLLYNYEQGLKTEDKGAKPEGMGIEVGSAKEKKTQGYDKKVGTKINKLKDNIINNKSNKNRYKDYNEKDEINPKGFNNFTAREYDYDDLEMKLLGWI